MNKLLQLDGKMLSQLDGYEWSDLRYNNYVDYQCHINEGDDMNLTVLYVLIFIVAMFGLTATIAVGVSQKNKEGNPTYDKSTGKIFLRLAIYYVIAIAGGYLAYVLWAFS
ncbi:hypothetical protein [Paenibacillus sp. H1-7]|uniref:hypothetical protein n=1 Tax=Paenibacillus sp. H1-7 TaxID=2282849 RepID=UPI001EF91F34|nr:hypothetical protein [Paenibacillus sp. H1-7]